MDRARESLPLFRGALRYRSHRLINAPCPRFNLARPFDRLDVFSLMSKAQFLPPIPCRKYRFERLEEIRWKLDFACFLVQLDFDLDAFAAFQSGRFAMAAA